LGLPQPPSCCEKQGSENYTPHFEFLPHRILGAVNLPPSCEGKAADRARQAELLTLVFSIFFPFDFAATFLLFGEGHVAATLKVFGFYHCAGSQYSLFPVFTLRFARGQISETGGDIFARSCTAGVVVDFLFFDA